MPFAAYKALHILGILLLFTSLGGLAALGLTKQDPHNRDVRRFLLAIHGGGLLVVLVAGFGMMARLGILSSWPPWVWIKLLVWVLLGASVALFKRLGSRGRPLLVALPLLGLLAAAAAIYHLGS